MLSFLMVSLPLQLPDGTGAAGEPEQGSNAAGVARHAARFPFWLEVGNSGRRFGDVTCSDAEGYSMRRWPRGVAHRAFR